MGFSTFKGLQYVQMGAPIDVIALILVVNYHTTYSRNSMGQKCEGNCGLWVLNEIIKRMYPESLKNIVGAVWELPAK